MPLTITRTRKLALPSVLTTKRDDWSRIPSKNLIGAPAWRFLTQKECVSISPEYHCPDIRRALDEYWTEPS
jgi:hypothetical protein